MYLGAFSSLVYLTVLETNHYLLKIDMLKLNCFNNVNIV